MNQQKHIMSAILILVAGGLIYLGFKKLPKSKYVVAPEKSIVSDKQNDSLTISQINGKNLYYKKCISCHGSFSKNDGPWISLAGLESQWPEKKNCLHLSVIREK